MREVEGRSLVQRIKDEGLARAEVEPAELAAPADWAVLAEPGEWPAAAVQAEPAEPAGQAERVERVGQAGRAELVEPVEWVAPAERVELAAQAVLAQWHWRPLHFLLPLPAAGAAPAEHSDFVSTARCCMWRAAASSMRRRSQTGWRGGRE